jgi:alpha 1,6-mannosyltransferase
MPPHSSASSMGVLRYVLIAALVAFTVLNVLSVNVLHPSVHDAKIEQAFKTAADLRSKNANSKDAVSRDAAGAANLVKDHAGHPLTTSKPKNSLSFTTTLDRLLYHFPYSYNDDVEKNIFQMWKTSDMEDEKAFPQECVSLIERWKTANEDYEHVLMSISEAEDAVVDLMRPLVPEVIDALRLLPNERLKFEFLKYLLVYLHGGVYADIDTTDVKPIKHWYNLGTIPTKIWLGVDADSNTEDWMDHYSRRLTFNTNIFRAKAYHPFLAKVIARITFIIFTQKDTIQSIDWEKEFDDVGASGAPLIQFTGTALFTDTAFEYMNTLDKYVLFRSLKNSNFDQASVQLKKKVFGPTVDTDQNFSYRSFTMLTNPTQVYDMAILPKISFTGYDSAQVDYFDDNDEKKGYDRFYYGRSKALTEWSPRRLRLDSN